MGFWAVVGIICGIAIGLGLALRITVLRIKESNDMGDSKGDMLAFSSHLNLICGEEDLHKPVGNVGPRGALLNPRRMGTYS
ncbi:MAG: hypothetical protein J6X66_12840 [Lachnospiraceae bacterium]|nr:hypothetical protein [Lachnospiraceae bacterium]